MGCTDSASGRSLTRPLANGFGEGQRAVNADVTGIHDTHGRDGRESRLSESVGRPRERSGRTAGLASLRK